MTINEKDRLDLRQALEELFADQRLAEIAMEAMPPIDYSSLATKRDLDALSSELRGEVAELRGEVAEFRGALDSGLANNLRVMIAAQLTTTMMLGAWVTAVS